MNRKRGSKIAIQVLRCHREYRSILNGSSAPTCGRIMCNNGLARREHKHIYEICVPGNYGNPWEGGSQPNFHCSTMVPVSWPWNSGPVQNSWALGLGAPIELMGRCAWSQESIR